MKRTTRRPTAPLPSRPSFAPTWARSRGSSMRPTGVTWRSRLASLSVPSFTAIMITAARDASASHAPSPVRRRREKVELMGFLTRTAGPAVCRVRTAAVLLLSLSRDRQRGHSRRVSARLHELPHLGSADARRMPLPSCRPLKAFDVEANALKAQVWTALIALLVPSAVTGFVRSCPVAPAPRGASSCRRRAPPRRPRSLPSGDGSSGRLPQCTG